MLFHGRLLRFPWIIIIIARMELSYSYLARFEEKGRNNRMTYTAAVVEYLQIYDTFGPALPAQILELNSDKYIEFISEAKLYNADIVVFPEYGLTSLYLPGDRVAARPYLLPVPEVGENPCKPSMPNSTSVIQKLSCAALDNKIYVVINLGEIHISSARNAQSQCRGNKGICHFNTNVVFDRSGTIIAKYHKYNLYFENQFDAPLNPEYVTFDTDFGVTFGTFVCFDLMFEQPAIQLLRDGVKNFVVTMAWVDEVPFLTAPQANTIWSMSANTNLFVSGYHEPGRGTLGSGIYSGAAGALNYTFDPKSGSNFVIAEVPIVPYVEPVAKFTERSPKGTKDNPEATSSIFTVLTENLLNYSSIPLHHNQSAARICHHLFCCTLKYKLTTRKGFCAERHNATSFILVAFSGFRNTARETAKFGWEVCAVTRWPIITGNTTTTTNSKFNEFKLTAKRMRVQAPMAPSLSTLDAQFQPIPLGHFTFSRSTSNVYAESNSLQNINVQTIALINRIY